MVPARIPAAKIKGLWARLWPHAESMDEFLARFEAYAATQVGQRVVIKTAPIFWACNGSDIVSRWHGMTGEVTQWTLLGQYRVKLDNGVSELFSPQEVIREGQVGWEECANRLSQPNLT